ncbi:MAG: geranylgeranyl reductase family protein [Acidimicrobiia bacterium]|nr:geranylgeranyl reductase family protein [Acidimicrobiia bacterium]MYC57060.1 geranylgeranyl reductase family protein [Acidimicrobiia bacterium]MYG93667.1 geranylgeranyl reductase family protein [Acidimicrobiia bacterium]MYI30137.1 geranylgeranyl reductase family protein [Acidimicrobiia bacterium]
MTQVWDAVVVGAGPAGCAAAITLARAGHQVVVVDRAHFPRPKTCGDGLTTGALRLLEGLGLDPNPIRSWMPAHKVHLRSPSGRQVEFVLPRNRGQFAAVVPRLELDNALVQRAKAEGVEVIEGSACTGVTERSDLIEIALADKPAVQASYLIAADGMWSPTRKYLGLSQNGYRGEWHAFCQYWNDVSPAASRSVWVWFEEEILPGYMWLFPLPDGRANVGFGIRRNGKVSVSDMGSLWQKLPKREHIRAVIGDNATPEINHRAWPIPACIDKIPLTSQRTMFAGDAAAAADPMSGEGIAQALLTGIAAANAIMAGGNAENVMASYLHLVRRELFADHRMARRLGRIMHTQTGVRAAIRIAGLSSWTRRNFVRWLFEDYPRSILTTPSRWSRKPFTTPGAYRKTTVVS